MIISHKYKIIFIHIPKNAGTFITKILRYIDDNLDTTYIGHPTAEQAKNMINPLIWNSYTKFCVIRDTYERIVSLYSYIKMYDGHNEHNLVKNLSFDQYLLTINNNNIILQVSMIFDSSGNRLVDNIINFNNLNVELKQFLIEKIGVDIKIIETIQFLDKINVSPKEFNSIEDYYKNTINKNIVLKFFKKDIEFTHLILNSSI
jgi:hypothetical protein